MLGSTRSWFACRKIWLPVMLVAMVCCLTGAAQASADTGVLRIEVLHNGRNISASCLGTVVDSQIGNIAFLTPEGDALVARVLPGQYIGTVYSAEDRSLPQQIINVTVGAGETVSKTVELGKPSDWGPWAGQTGSEARSDEGETAGTPFSGTPSSGTSSSGTPSSGASGSSTGGSGDGTSTTGEQRPGSSGTESIGGSDGDADSDGDETSPRDRDQGDPWGDRVIIGEIVFSWSAVCRAEGTSTYHYRAEDDIPNHRESEKHSRTRMEVVYSGNMRFPATGITDGIIDYGQGVGDINATGRGQSDEMSRTVTRDLCFSGGRYYEREFTSINQTQTMFQTRPKPNVPTPTVLLYPTAVKVTLPMFTDALECRAVTRSVTKGESCEGSSTSEDGMTTESSLYLCELVLFQAHTSPEFLRQLEVYRPHGPYTHTTYTARHEYVDPQPLQSVDSNPIETRSIQGYVEFTYTVTYTEYSRDPQ